MFASMKTPILKGLALMLFVAINFSPLYAQTATPDKAQTPAPASDPQPTQSGVSEDLGYGVGSVLANMFYIPAKITYAGLGLMTGGVGYLLTGFRGDVANNIIYPAVGGNYVVTPSQLKGTDPLYFVGAPPPDSSTPAATQSAADSPTVNR